MAKTLLISNNIFDGRSKAPFSGGILIEGDKIIGILSRYEAEKAKTNVDIVKDYGQKLITPGFIDSHIHVGWTMDILDETYAIDLTDTSCKEDVMEHLITFRKNNPDCKVVYGVNFNLFSMQDNFVPTAADFDKFFPDIPVAIVTWELHTWYTNSAFMKMAGIDDNTPDPMNGMIRDASGHLTGGFNDSVAFAFPELIKRPLMEREGALIHFNDELNRYGITSIGEVYPYGPDEPYPLYKKVEENGNLTVRYTIYPPLLDTADESITAFQKEYCSPMLQFGGLKCLLDGVIGVHTAWMKEPYTDAPDTKGFPAVDTNAVRIKMLNAHSKGIACRIHAIGDQAIHFVLDLYEEAEKTYGKIPKHHCIEHLEYIDDDDLEKIGQLNLVAAMQGRHITFYVDDDAKNIVGPEREKLAFRWRDVLDVGGTIGSGSDFSVVHFSPFRGIYAAVTRCVEDGHPEGGWLPEQCVTLPEALTAYTYGAAAALNREHEIGSLEVGKYADICVLDHDLFSIPPKEILNTMPEMTMVGGNIVFGK